MNEFPVAAFLTDCMFIEFHSIRDLELSRKQRQGSEFFLGKWIL